MLRIFRISDWPFIVKLITGPAVGLAALGFLAWLGVSRIEEQSVTVDTLIHDHEAIAKLDKSVKGMQVINGGMFRVLALQAAQTAGLDTGAEMALLGKQVDGVEQILRDYRDHDAIVAQRPEVDGLIADVEKYKGAIAWVTQMLDVDFGSAVSFLKPFESSFAEMNNRLAAMTNALTIAAQNDAQAAAISAASTKQTFQFATGGAFAMVILIAAAIGPATVRSIRRIASVTLALANGETSVDTAGLHRRDELGAIVSSLDVFRDGLLRVRSLQAEQEQEREHAEKGKREAMVRMAETIEAETSLAIEKVSQRTSAMAALANGMRDSASRTGTSAQSAAQAAAHAMANVQTVAGATEQLSASSREIGSQVDHSTRIVGLAVQAGNDTRATIEALNERVLRIGAVADMIGSIASQTNLLALNATIEAARAGDAGKGFAVVASEVKALATQTARSTQEITRHIGEVRAATEASVAAVSRIEKTISEMNAIAGSIAAAVEQQGSATAEIARSVTETAGAANEMAERVAEVSAEAERTGAQATEVHESTTILAGAVVDLKGAVIRMVRTSSAEVNRRKTPRIETDIGCRITAGSNSAVSARLVDISEGGACIAGTSGMQPGETGTLEVNGVGTPLAFTVRSVGGGQLHVSFRLDAAATISITKFVEGLRRTKVAA